MRKSKYFLATLILTLLFLYENTSVHAAIQSFSLSPDGKRLAYCTPVLDEDLEKGTRVLVYDLKDKKEQKVATLSGTYWNIYWVNNDRIIGWQIPANISNRIPIIFLNTNKIKWIDVPACYREIYSSVSPDGNWLVFNGSNTEKKNGVICLVNLENGQIKEIYEGYLANMPAWSPDSKRIAFGLGWYQKDYPLLILDINTGKVTDTGKKGVGIDWSSDGTSIVYTGNILRGGSWFGGVPTDGSIVKTNLKTDLDEVLTDTPVNVYNQETESWKLSGTYLPQYSPSGKKILYFSEYFIQEKREDKERKEGIWVMNVNGSEKKMIFPERLPCAWGPDSDKIFVQRENEILAIDINTLQKEEIVKWENPKVPEITDEGWQELENESVKVRFWGLKPEYAKAFQSICTEARKTYKDLFSLSLPDKLYLQIVKHPDKRIRLWTDGNDHIYLDLDSTTKLAPSYQSGVFNIYGMCHELGHIAMYRKMRDLVGLPDGVGEGWAHYAGSVVVDEIYKTLGEKIYPQPYNFAQFEGIARLQKQTVDKEMLTRNSTMRAASMFYNLHLKYGPEKVGKTLSLALEENPEGVKLMPFFQEKMIQVTGDKEAGMLIPEEFLVSKTRWEVKEKEITKETFEGLQAVTNNDTVLLKYDDGTMDGERSMSGSGHAVLFKKPEGDWSAVQVQIYASRYGSPEPPKENFRIYFCNKDFEVIKKIEKSYSIFERGEEKWYTIDINPVRVPDVFYVCIDFNPTATKGVYVSFDKDVVRSHSRNALPYTYVSDVKEKFDWMIRLVLKKPVG